MRRPDEAHTTVGLFDEAPADAVEKRMDPVEDLWPAVAVAGVRIDFREPSAARVAAKTIFNLATTADRVQALAQVPANFQGMVRDLVERAFYNAKRERQLADR